MTISSENRKAGPFLGTGAVSEYPFDFSVFSAADLLVVMADANGAESTLVLNSDYTVGLNADQDADPGGTVTLTTPLPADHLLVITSDIAALQPTDLTNQGGFYPAVVNAALDRLTILAQQLRVDVDRAAKLPITRTEDANELLARVVMVADNMPSVQAVGDNIGSVNATAPEIASVVEVADHMPDILAALADLPSLAAKVSKTGDTMSGNLDVPSLNGGQLAGMRNRVINGCFRVNQRGYVSGSATVGGEYTLDRWKVTGTGGITFEAAAGKTTVNIPSGQTIQQVIEGLNLESGDYVLSWSGTAQGRIGSGSYGASGTVTANVTGGANTTIEFNSGTVSEIQFERGTIATPFERRLYSAEEALCQRYGEPVSLNSSGGSGVKYLAGPASNAFNTGASFKANKRVTPTISVLAGTINYTNASNLTYVPSIYGVATRVSVTSAGNYGASSVTLWADAEF